MKVKTTHILWSVIALMSGIVVFAPFPAAGTSQPALRTFRIQASQFAYDPGEIHVNPGDTVRMELVSMDVVHGVYVDGYGVSITADPGQTSSLTFVADKPGVFRLRCNVTCGAMHPFMIGKLYVGLNTWMFRSIGMVVISCLSAFAVIWSAKNKNENLKLIPL
jgi:heme/copper-type cytochrome/quinol oxidase subunit 2